MRQAALGLALVCAGCAGQTVPAPPNTAHWNMALVTRPAPPRQLDPAQFQVQIRDKAGRPVSGASVLVRLTMPAMDMGPNQATAQAGAAGVYTGGGRFTMPGDWLVTVQADKGRLHQSQSFPVKVR